MRIVVTLVSLMAPLLALSAVEGFAAHILVHDPLTGKALGLAGDGAVLVKVRQGANRARLHVRAGGTWGEDLLAPGWVQVRLKPGVSVEEALRRYGADPEVERVQPNYLYRRAGVAPNDPLFSSQYSLAKISASAAWDIETGASRKVTVAILDTGIDRTHPDLSSKLDTANWSAFCPGSGAGCVGACSPCSGGTACDGPINDTLGHGTAVAGIIGAATNNAEGMAGVSWSATLLPIKIFDADGCADSISLSNALNYVTGLATSQAATVGPVVVNMSVGEEPSPATAAPSCDSGADVVTLAVQNALNNNLVLVAAAGNIESPSNYQEVQCPGRIPGVVAVGATDAFDSVASFSARGAALDIVAPGVSVLATSPGGNYITESGTSFSAPHVAGIAALLRALQPGVAQSELTSWLYAGADDVGQAATLQGHGRANAYRSARLASRGTLSDLRGEKKVIAFPNPFKPGNSTLAISVPSAIAGAGLSVKVFTQTGELVRTLQAPTWDGKNDAGFFVASGMYILLVQTDKGRGKGRIALLR